MSKTALIVIGVIVGLIIISRIMDSGDSKRERKPFDDWPCNNSSTGCM